MNMTQWVDARIQAAKDAGSPTTRRKVVEDLAERSGVSYGSLAPTDRGGRLVMYDKALLVSEATGFQVTTIELCDPHPGVRLAQIRAVVAE